MTPPTIRRIKAGDVLRAIEQCPGNYLELASRLGTNRWRIKNCMDRLFWRGFVCHHVVWPSAGEYRVTLVGRALLAARRAGRRGDR